MWIVVVVVVDFPTVVGELADLLILSDDQCAVPRFRSCESAAAGAVVYSIQRGPFNI